MADLDSLAGIKKGQEQAAKDAAPANQKATAKKAGLHIAINQIRHIGEDGKPTDVVSGDPFYPAEVDLDTLLKLAAIRPATEAEVALYERQNPPVAADEALG